jgi:hypothetical protein
MLITTLRIIAYAWLGVLVISAVVLGLLFVVELAARAIRRRGRS